MSVALITGCSSGFGMLAAVEMARRGDKVFASMRDTSKANPLRDAASQAGVEVELIDLDVNDSESVDWAVADIIKRGSRIDVLVNNAGIGTHGPIEAYDDDELREVFETNVFGVVRVTRAVLPHMRAQQSGRIINVSSLAGKTAAPFQGVYAASKHAVEALSDSLHFELNQFGIRVVIIEPGRFETQFGANRNVARRFTEGSPYAAEDQRFNEAMQRLPGSDGPAPDAQAVAVAIADAAHAEDPQRRYLVGNDAQAVGALHKQLSDEQFENTIRQALNWPK